MPIGLPGSGKSTYLSRIADIVIVSGDGIRRAMFGDEGIQYTDTWLKALCYDPSRMSENQKKSACSEVVWTIVDKRIIQLLKSGKSVGYDGINTDETLRRAAIRRFQPFADIHGLYFKVDPAVCLERNRNRKRQVEEEWLKGLASHIAIPKLMEGFQIIDVIDENGAVIQRLDGTSDEDRPGNKDSGKGSMKNDL